MSLKGMCCQRQCIIRQLGLKEARVKPQTKCPLEALIKLGRHVRNLLIIFAITNELIVGKKVSLMVVWNTNTVLINQ